MKTLIYLLLLCATLGLNPATRLHAAEATIAQTLEKAVFEEESNRNLDAAILGYKGVLTAYDNQRNLAATAVFRLGECYRKQGKTNDAALQFQRLIQQFPDQPTLIGLSLKTLDSLGVQPGGTAQTTAATPNMDAAEAEELQRLKRLFKDSPDLLATKKSESESTPLYIAAAMGHLEVIRFLLDQGIPVDSLDKGGSALYTAAWNGRASAVKLLLERGAKVDAINYGNDTALCNASAKGFQSVAELLINAGANVNAHGIDQITPLHNAALIGSLPLAKLLISKGADVNARQRDGSTPLMLATTPAIATFLIDNNAVVNATNGMGDTALRLAIGKKDSIPLMETLLKHGANPNATNNAGSSVLGYAVNFGVNRGSIRTEEAILLLKNHADPNFQYQRSDPYLFTAVFKSDNRLLEALLQAGAKPDLAGPNIQSALFIAVETCTVDAVRLLLEGGANPNRFDLSNSTPLYTARIYARSVEKTDSDPRKSNYAKIIKLLLDRGADDTLYRSQRISGTRTNIDWPVEVFQRNATNLNSFTLFELLAACYSGGVPSLGDALNFSDFSRISVNRLAGTNGTTTNITVNVQAAFKTGDCSANIPLQWGDVVVIPELDHPVQESWNGLTLEDSKALAKCLARQVSVISKGRTNQLNLQLEATGSQFPSGVGGVGRSSAAVQSPFKFTLRSVLQANGLILASSDLSRVKVRRKGVGGSSVNEMTLDISSAIAASAQRNRGGLPMPGIPAPGFGNFNPTSSISIDQNELWLKDGDVIEIPDK